MTWISLSSQIGLTVEEAIELANKRLEFAFKEDDHEKAFQFSKYAKLLLSEAETIFDLKKAKDPTLSNGIANAYREHGRLLEELGYRDKAKKSRRKAEKWGNIQVVGLNTEPSRKNEAIHRPLLPTHASSASLSVTALSTTVTPSVTAAPEIVFAMDQDIPKSDVAIPVEANNEKPTPGKDAGIPQKIFYQNIIPVNKYPFPEAGKRITSTPQLAYCLSLLHSSTVSKEELSKSENDWLQATVANRNEQERLQTMATDVVRAFVRDEFKKSGVVDEVVSLAIVLGQDDLKTLLQEFYNLISQSALLYAHLLDGLAQLIRNAAPRYIDIDDLVKILELLYARLMYTHKQSVQYTYQLVLTISRVLDSMVDINVKGLSRERLYDPLSSYLKRLQQDSDSYLVYQAAYAYQALQYIPDDEPLSLSIMKAVRELSGAISAVARLDTAGYFERLQSLLQVTEGTYRWRRSWYPALRGLDILMQEGRFTVFEELVRRAPCRHDPLFQSGVCQRLGEIAENTIWDLNTRKCAVAFLVQLYKDDASKNRKVTIMQWILDILKHLTKSSKDIIEGPVQELLQEAQVEGVLYRGYGNDNPALHLMAVAPTPMESTLIDRVQNIPDVETPLRQLRQERLKSRDGNVYVSPRAKATPRATDDFDLTAKVQEFLASDRRVFLVLGDSGTGKSAFSKALEISLWDNYDRIDRRIPLFIHLPEIDKPEQDLIGKHLRKVKFTDTQIRELEEHREFILICDGYDEIQETRNLYMSNRLNQPGHWRAQMVISCRTGYGGVEYTDCFQPTDRNSGGDTKQFQEAIISPFTKEQIQYYIGQYVSLQKSPWGSGDYLKALEQIPNLKDLVKNPFLLKLSLEVLPRLLKTKTEFSPAHIPRVQLYDEFVTRWIGRGKIRLKEMKLSPYDRKIFKRMTDSGFQRHGITYLKELVTAIYEHQNGNPVVHYSEHDDRRTWKEAFFSERDGSHLLREVIPLTRNGDQYQLIHKSFLEYGLTLTVTTPSVYRRGSTSSVTVDAQSLLDSPLGRIYFVGKASILQFLVERVQQEPEFKDQLHSVIERSKSDKTALLAAANAITILTRAGVRFNGADLRNIKIPGADLSFGMFDSAQLEGADLRKVNLRNVWMRQANLRGAQMKGVQFGELPFLEEDSEVRCCAYSPDGKIYAAGLDNGDISLYETSSWYKVHTLIGHDGGVNSLSFSTTSDRMASGSNDMTVRLWDIDIGECIHTLHGHNDCIRSVVHSPKGGLIASGSDDDTVQLWDVDTGKCVFVFQDHSHCVRCIVYSPKGDRVASGSWDKTVRLWDVESGKCIHTLVGHTDRVHIVVYSPDGDRIASGSDDYTVRLWDVDTGECVHILKGHDDLVHSVVYSPKGCRIASGSSDKTVRLWNVDTGECTHTLYGHSSWIVSVAYSPNGDRIASGSSDRTVRLWDIDTGKCTHALHGHSNSVSDVVFSPNGDQIASVDDGKIMRVWDVDAEDSIHAFQDHIDRVFNVVYSPKGDRIASGTMDGTLRLWDIDTGECVHTFQGHSDNVFSVAYSPKMDRIASGSGDKTVRLWDVDTGKCVHTLQGHIDYVRTVVYSPKGDRIVSGSDDDTVRLWNVDTGECVHTLLGHGGDVNSVIYSPKGDQIASASSDSTVRLWDVDTGKCIHTLLGHHGLVHSVVYSPKGDRIATGSDDRTVRLWDVDTAKCIHTLLGHSSWVRSVTYSPKGDRIVSGSNDNTVRLWDADIGESIHILRGHSNQVRSVVYSPEGDRIASGSDDKTVKLWNVETGQCLGTISGFSDPVSSIVFASESELGARLVTSSFGKSVHCWQVIKGEDGHKVILRWSSSHEALTVSDVSFGDARGLSQLNRKLLIQRGALA